MTVCIGIAGCTSINELAPPVTSALLGAGRGAGEAQLSEGRRIYTTQCTSCHAAEPVAKYAGEWPGIIEEMAPKSKLRPEQARAVLSYVLAAERLPKVPQ